ncbi:hypothetical protein BGZ83_004268, partial [Gryganskiella cystojenkinii]
MAVTYRHVVDDMFDIIWEEQLATAVAVPVDDQTNSSSNDQNLPQDEKPSHQYRTCGLPLRRLLRKEFSKSDIEHIHDLFDHSQETLSAHVVEIQTAILKAHAEIYRGLLHPPESVKEAIDINMFLPETFTIRDPDLLTNPIVTIVRTDAEFLEIITDACDGKTEDGAEDDEGGSADTAQTGPGDESSVNPRKTTKKKKEAVESAVDQNKTEKAHRNRVKSDIKGLFTQDFIQYVAARLSKVQTTDSGHNELTDDGAGIEAGPSTRKQQLTLGVKKKMPSQSVQFDVDDDAGIQDSLTPTGSKRDRGQALPIPPDNVSERHPLWDKVVEK